MEIKIKSPRGVKLLTEQKYCLENIDVVPELQNKMVTPTDTAQTVTPDAEFAGLGSVTVEPGTVTADATATADDIRLGKTAYGASGKMTGTITDYDGSSEPTSGKSLFAQLVDRSITEVTLEDLDGITKIEDYTFYQCSNLRAITIPESVTIIGDNAFNECLALIDFIFPTTITDIGIYAFMNCIKLTSAIIPNSITTLKSGIFYYCYRLANIIIPASITRLDSGVFRHCSTSTELGGTYTILATTPPTIQSNTFQDAKINKIIVPKGTSAAYKAATNWSALADKIVEATE